MRNQLVDDRHDLIAAANRERASRTKIILNVDQYQRAFYKWFHAQCLQLYLSQHRTRLQLQSVGGGRWAVGSRQRSSQLFDEFAYQFEPFTQVVGVRTETDSQVLA